MAAPVIVVSGPVGVGKTTVARRVAQCFDRSVHLQVDDFLASIVRGSVAPTHPDAAHQGDVVGAAVGSAALRYADGGYTVVLDGHLFPDSVAQLAAIYAPHAVALHYAVLRADLETCMARAGQRGLESGRFRFDARAVAQLHARFADLGRYEPHVIGAGDAPGAVAEAVVAGVGNGSLLVVP